MKGTILDYSVENDLGYISGDDGKGYTFTRSNWTDTDSLPKKNLRVDFDIEGNKAIDIFVIPEMDSNVTQSSFLEKKEQIFTRVKSKDNLKKIYSQIKIFWNSIIYPNLKYLGKKFINYFDNLADISNSKRINRTTFYREDVQLGYNMTTCKDCGHIVSKSARQCPNCGAILKQDNISAIFGFIALFTRFLCFFIPVINIPIILIISFIFSLLTSYKSTSLSFMLGLISFLLNCYILLQYLEEIKRFNQ